MVVKKQITNFFSVFYKKFIGSFTNSKRLVPVLVIIIVALSGVAYYFYTESSILKRDPNKAILEETDKIVAEISKLIVLPEGEVPTLATVANPEALRNQPFFSKAKRGDRVLIYSSARKAILYDQKNNKIIEVAPINIGEPPK
ncbi:MAG: hypothetical protein AAB799_01720 [Patescibacteria group bacterium]